MPNGRVIVTHGRSLHALAAARSLARRGVEVIGCDSVPWTSLSFSKVVAETFLHPDPREFEDERAFVAAVAEASAKYRADDRPVVLMPLGRRMPSYARHRDLFEPGVAVAAPPADAIARVHPKDRLVETVAYLDVPSPRTTLFRDVASARSAGDAVTFPAVVKPAESHGGIGVSFVDDRRGFEAALDEIDRKLGRGRDTLLVQEPVDGEDYCFTAICVDGGPRAAAAYCNLRTLPTPGGPGVKRESVDPAPFLGAATTLLRGVGWRGVAQLDFRWDGRGGTAPKLIEVNPRFWGGLFESISSGVDYPSLLYELTVTGRLSEEPESDFGVRTKVPGVNAYAWLHEVFAADDAFAKARELWKENADHERGRADLAREHLGTRTDDETVAEFARDRVEVFANDDDPWAAFGFLYVLGSLARYGRWPEEFSRTGRS